MSIIGAICEEHAGETTKKFLKEIEIKAKKGEAVVDELRGGKAIV